MILRVANESDIPGMRMVRSSVHENVLSDPARIAASDYIDILESLGRTWVIESEGEVVAFASAYSTGSFWALFVHPDHEGKGYGSTLHSITVEWLWSLGHSQLWLTTGAGTRAENFYISKGWQSSGSIADGELRFVLNKT